MGREELMGSKIVKDHRRGRRDRGGSGIGVLIRKYSLALKQSAFAVDSAHSAVKGYFYQAVNN